MSGASKILGLTTPEWAMESALFFFIMIALNSALYSMLLVGTFHIVYVRFLAKLEENIFEVLLENLRIPSVLKGSFRPPFPMEKLSDESTDR